MQNRMHWDANGRGWGGGVACGMVGAKKHLRITIFKLINIALIVTVVITILLQLQPISNINMITPFSNR